MDKQHQSRVPPIAAIVLLLLPILNVVSYLALVWPDRMRCDMLDSRWEVFPKYRYRTEAWAGTVYWPLEQIDCKLRPKAWVRVGDYLRSPRGRQIEQNLGGDF